MTRFQQRCRSSSTQNSGLLRPTSAIRPSARSARARARGRRSPVRRYTISPAPAPSARILGACSTSCRSRRRSPPASSGEASGAPAPAASAAREVPGAGGGVQGREEPHGPPVEARGAPGGDLREGGDPPARALAEEGAQVRAVAKREQGELEPEGDVAHAPPLHGLAEDVGRLRVG